MPRPDLSRVPVFYHNYIAHVKEDDLMQALSNNTALILDFLQKIPEQKREYRYAENKWTVKEVLQHIVDAERIFNYRALRFARKDQTPLPGFDEKNYTERANANKRNWDDIVEEFKAVRKSTECLFASFDEEQLDSSGIANENTNYGLGIGFITVGHSLHHMNVIKERYL